MEIHVELSGCERIDQISCYDSNYYTLPFTVNGCGIIHESYSGGDFSGCSIGVLVNDNYVPQYYLHQEECSGFNISSETIGRINQWT